MRKIVQISVAENGIVSLCNDGTVWVFVAPAVRTAEPYWKQIIPIPQDDESEADEA